jgi:hypothetical protein
MDPHPGFGRALMAAITGGPTVRGDVLWRGTPDGI